VSSLEEKEHLAIFRNGSATSFQWLYNLYFGQVYNYCQSFLNDHQEAEEVTAEVFVVLWKKRASIYTHHSLRPLLFKITRDLVWNRLKQIASHRERKLKYLASHSFRRSVHGSEVIIYREQEEVLRTALKQLPPQQEKVFTLRFLKGRDLNQIAEELEISKNTVKVHLAKSKRFVVNCLTGLLSVILLFYPLSL